jgi:hypothetical protein
LAGSVGLAAGAATAVGDAAGAGAQPLAASKHALARRAMGIERRCCCTAMMGSFLRCE